MIKTRVTITLSHERHALCGNTPIVFSAGAILAGDLTIEPSDGPLGSREYEYPNYASVTFDFSISGRKLRYMGLISQWDLWAPTGTHVQTECSDFDDQIGQLDGMMDGRDDWSYVLPDGRIHANHLKYASCKFWVMLQSSTLLVRCEYYDQNTDIAAMVTIFYTRPLEELVLLNDTALFYDSYGEIEDFDLHGGETIILKPAVAG